MPRVVKSRVRIACRASVRVLTSDDQGMNLRRDPLSRPVSGRRSLRLLPIFVAALAVIAGMLVMADYARRQADQARQAQALMERVRTLGAGIDSLTWRRLASGRGGGTDAVVSEGLDHYEQLTASLRRLRTLGVPRSRTADVERRLGEAYGEGMQALLASRQDPALGGRIAKDRFAPAMRRFDAAIAGLAADQDGIARAAQQRTWLGSLGSLDDRPAAALPARLADAPDSAAVRARRAGARRRAPRRGTPARARPSLIGCRRRRRRQLAVQWVAESVRSALGYDPAVVVGARLMDHVHTDDAVAATRFLEKVAMRSGRAGSLSVRLRAADGDYRAVEVIAHNHIGDPLIDGILLNFRDVSERVALEEQLRHQAFHDDLTGLANRALFEDRLTLALARARRHDGQLAVVFVDLDDFKTVNDGLGHAVGDELLRATAQRLASCLRAQDTAARLGGDEFAVLLEDLSSPDEAWAIAERMRHALELPLSSTGARSSRRRASAWSARVRTRPRTTCSEMPTSRCMQPRTPARAVWRASSRSCARSSSSEWSSAASSAWPWSATSCSWSISRWSSSTQADHRRRGPYPLAAPDARAPGARPVHRARRVHRAHRRDRRLGPPDGLRSAAPLAGPPTCGAELEMSVNVSTRQLADPEFPRDVARPLPPPASILRVSRSRSPNTCCSTTAI